MCDAHRAQCVHSNCVHTVSAVRTNATQSIKMKMLLNSFHHTHTRIQPVAYVLQRNAKHRVWFGIGEIMEIDGVVSFISAARAGKTLVPACHERRASESSTETRQMVERRLRGSQTVESRYCWEREQEER